MRSIRLALDLVLWPPVTLTAALSATAGIAAQWGRVSLKWDVLAHFAPVWLAISAAALAFAPLFGGWRRWTVVVPALLGMAAAGSLIAPEYLRPAGPQAAAGAPDQLKIVQFNVWHENPEPEAILAWLDKERPDIAIIEENSSRFSKALAAHKGWSVACPRCEVVILSRQPPIKVDNALENAGPYTPVTRAVFRDRRGLFEVAGVHLAWPTDADHPYQERRLARLISTTPRDLRDRSIITGDFNSAPWSFARRRWDEAFGLPRRERAVPSWPARTYKSLKWLGLPFLPIDHVYAGQAWATVSVRRGPRLSSDHYPLVVTLAPAG
jgi:endonuclease/exonuclease/phosphatase (EEP) superfamily protein YafD